MDTEQHK